MVWSNVGFYVVLFGAAMQAIPRDIYEAVLLDGASRWTTLRGSPSRCSGTPSRWPGSTWPSPRWTGSSWCSMMTDGGPNYSSDVIGLRMYNTAFGSETKFGYASAIGVVMFFLTLSVAVLPCGRPA